MNAPANLTMWNRLEVSDERATKKFDKGKFKGTAVDAIYNVKRVTAELGPVGFAWGWEVKSERVESYGEGKDQKTLHSCVVRAWFRQQDGSKEYVEHIGTTMVAYWTRSGYYEVDEEAPKKSVTDALSKIMVNLGASADIWLGRFDGNKYVAPDKEDEEKPATRQRVAPEHGDSDGDRLARASRPVATREEPEPVAGDRGQPTFVLDGVRLVGEDWIAAAVLTAKRLQPSALLIWWDKAKDERARLHRQRPDLNETLEKLKAKVLAKAETFNGTAGAGTVSPSDALRAG